MSINVCGEEFFDFFQMIQLIFSFSHAAYMENFQSDSSTILLDLSEFALNIQEVDILNSTFEDPDNFEYCKCSD